MKKIAMIALIAAQLSSPATAAELMRDASAQERRMGAFAGARFRISLDRAPRERVRAGLSLSPTIHDLRADGSASMRIGEGLEFGASERRAPGVLLAGQPVSALVQRGEGPDGRRQNVSTVAWVAIGVGVVAVSVFLLYGLCGSGEICSTDDD